MKGPESVQCTADGMLSNPYAGIQFAFDKRRRNLEKRKSRLLQYEADLKIGKKLSEQQVEARYCIGEVETQLEFLKDISRTLASLQKEYLRSVKQRDEEIKKEYAEKERKFLENFMCYRNVIEQFGKEEVKEAFINGTNNAVKLTGEEYNLMEKLFDTFGQDGKEMEGFLEYKARSEEVSKLAYRILVGGKEKIIDNFSGACIRELLDKVVNCGYVRDGADEGDQSSDKSGGSPLEAVTEQPKKDPKVVFVHVANGSVENYAEGEINRAGDTEFGFEGCVEPKVLVRDPPPPIPLPVTVVPEDPTNTVSGTTNRDDIWRVAKSDSKPGASKRRAEAMQNGFVNPCEQINGFEGRGGERRQAHGGKGGAQRNDYGSGGAKGNDFGKGFEGEQRAGGRNSGGGGRRQERDGFDAPRNSRGGSRANGRFSGNAGGRGGGASNFASRSGHRNGNNGGNQGNAGHRADAGRDRGFIGNGFNGPPPQRRHLGFNFASDAF